MKKYFLSTYIDYSYNGIEYTEHSDSLEFYDTLEESLSFAYQNLIAEVSHIDELSKIKAYINMDMLSKPNVNWNITSGSVRCSITKENNILTMSIEQTMIVDKQKKKISITYSFVPNEIELSQVGYVIYGIFDSDIHAYAERISNEVLPTIKSVMEKIKMIKEMKMNNLCDFKTSIVDNEYVNNQGIDEYEKEKRKGMKI